jgi:hypothetical protein
LIQIKENDKLINYSNYPSIKMKLLVVLLPLLLSSFLVAQSDIVKDKKSKEIPLMLRLEQHFEECERKVDSLCKATGLEKYGYFKDGVAYRIVDVTPNGFPVIEIDEIQPQPNQ